MYKPDLVLNKLQGLICHKSQLSRDGSRRRGGGNDTLPPLN